MRPRSSPSLFWLSLAVLGPVILLAVLAWMGTRAQLKAAWTEAREEATALSEGRSSSLAAALEDAIRSVPDYPDPPVPGAPSELDAILDGKDPVALLALRDNLEAGLSPAGLPRRALAALRLHALDPTAQKSEDVVKLLTKEAPSVLTSFSLHRLKFPSPILISEPLREKLGERAPSVLTALSLRELEGVSDTIRSEWMLSEFTRSFARKHLGQSLSGHWSRRDADPFWARRTDERLEFISSSEIYAILDDVLVGLPVWTRASLQLPSEALVEAPHMRPLVTTEVPFGTDGLTLSLGADPAILEKSIRTQQNWTFVLLATAVLVAGGSLYTIHHTVARERHLAELKSQFVSSVSHELRAPLGSIRLMAEALQEERVSRPAEFHKLIAREGARLTHLIENVLDFARIEEGRKSYRFEECDLVALIRETIELMQPLAKEREVTLTSDLSELTVTADPAALQQALINLLDNALKFSPKGGKVTVAAESIRPADTYMIKITDQGPGIPSAQHEKVFERFHRLGNELRRETQGTGIGLSIVKHIAEAHGGSVAVASAPPDGSTFTLTLPLEPCAS